MIDDFDASWPVRRRLRATDAPDSTKKIADETTKGRGPSISKQCSLQTCAVKSHGYFLRNTPVYSPKKNKLLHSYFWVWKVDLDQSQQKPAFDPKKKTHCKVKA